MTSSTGYGGTSQGAAAGRTGAPVAAAPCKRTLKPCGTYAAAQRHKDRGEPIDAACVEARRAWWRERARIIRSIPALYQRDLAYRREWRRADEERRRWNNAARERNHRRQLERDRADRMHAVDQVVVDRLVAGVPVTANRVERLTAVRLLHEEKRSYDEIAQRVRISSRQVHRDLSDLGLVDARETA